MLSQAPIVIVGAGHAGVQAAAALREEGVTAPIHLVSAERAAPYARPPLSKAFLQGNVCDLPLREDSFYARQGIELVLDDPVATVDRSARRVRLSSSNELEYAHLVLATGSQARPLPGVPENWEGVHMLRSLDDAVRLREALNQARSVVIVGAGYIGLEVAAVAAAQGREVRVVEVAPRVLARSASPQTADFLRTALTQAGIVFHLGERVQAFERSGARVRALRLSGGARLAADLVLVAVGAVPDDSLARACGLPSADGVEVDATLATPDPHVSAIGDCALHPNRFAGRRLRLESVQNATDQGRAVARRLAGRAASFEAVPWFWSDLGAWRLQIAGLHERCDRHVVRGSRDAGRFSVYGFRAGALACVESVNRPADHLLARRLLAAGVSVDPDAVADVEQDLKALLAGAQQRTVPT